MSDFVHLAEYGVEKKNEGAYGRKRRLSILLYILIPLAVLILMLAVLGAGAVIWYVPLCPTVLAIVIPLHYNRNFRTEYDYRISGGEFTVTELHNRRYPKELVKVKPCDALLIAPYTGKYRDMLEDLKPAQVMEAVSSLKAEDIYCMVYRTEDSENKAVLFEVTGKMLKLLSFYNGSTVMTGTRL